MCLKKERNRLTERFKGGSADEGNKFYCVKAGAKSSGDL